MARRLGAAAAMLAAFAFGAVALGPAAMRPAQAQGQGQGVPVEVAQVTTDTVIQEATAVGTLLSNESVIIRPEIAGRIVDIRFEEGEPVEKGQLLFKLDDSVYQAELADAEARLELARRNMQRARELFKKGAGTARNLDQAESEFQTATAAVELAKARLTKTTIEAPFAGIAGLRKVSMGDYVTAGQDMVNIEDIDPLKVDFSIPERYLGALKIEQTVRVTADAFPGDTFQGKVYATDPQIDTGGRSIRVRALIPNDDRMLRPGLFVRVRLQLERRENAILIPEQALVPRGEDRFVFKVVDGKAAQTKVEIGQRRFGHAEILSGLERGDIVVTAGQLKIRDGAPVQPVNQTGIRDDAAPGTLEPGDGDDEES
ncbi:efflux RND transporter periplasmic adaptor subunit [Ferruginivarius sediminum]|nr:efflux RND transporter periplasmic adaptor subunit [Ferruginivarius sediminum]